MERQRERLKQRQRREGAVGGQAETEEDRVVQKLEAAGASVAKATRSGPAVGSVLDEEAEVVKAGEGTCRGEGLPPVLHKAWEASRLRALNGVLSGEPQPKELLLGAVEAPWKEESGAGGRQGAEARRVKRAPTNLLRYC